MIQWGDAPRRRRLPAWLQEAIALFVLVVSLGSIVVLLVWNPVCARRTG